METNQSKGSSSWSGSGYLLVGIAIGAVLGLLYAPKSGEEIRSDLADLRAHNREKFKNLISRINGKLPPKVKIAAGYGTIKEGAEEASRELKKNIREAVS